MRNRFVATVAVASVAALGLAACGSSNTPTESGGAANTSLATKAGGAGGEVGVFTWWAAGSEKEGLDALEKLFKEKYPNNTFVNLAVAGGAGSNAKAKLASDLQNNQPPDSFQGHAGAELLDYIDAGQIEPVNDVITALGGDQVFPKNLLERITVNGNIYSVPSNIHRANVVWANTEVLKKAGINSVPEGHRELDGRHGQGQGRRCLHPAVDRWHVDAGPALRDRAHLHARAREVQRPLRRQDRVGLGRGEAGRGRLQEAADLRQHGVRR